MYDVFAVSRISQSAHCYLFSHEEVIIPFLPDARLPADLLLLVFEDDYRFWPEGEDPDKADNYKERVGVIAKRRRRSKGRNKIPRSLKEEEDPPLSPDAEGSSSAGAYRPDAKGREQGKHSIAAPLHAIAGIH